MKKLLVIGILSGLFGGCATLEATKEPVDYDSTYKKVMVSEDQYTGNRTYTGPLLTLKGVKFGESDLMIGYLSYVKSKKGQDIYCLITRYDNKNWAFFKRAYDTNQKEFPVIEVKKNVGQMFGDVQITESNCIQLNKAYLDNAASNNGLDIKLIGENKQQIIKVNNYYVKGFIDAVNFSEKNRFNK